MFSTKAADLRRFLFRHAKSDGIDADTVARLRPLDLPDIKEVNGTTILDAADGRTLDE